MSGQTTGRFLALEGIDGSGKSTQLQLLLERLRARGVECCGTREPSDGPVGAMIRQILTGRVTADNRVIAGLFAADRLDHLVNRRDGILEQVRSGVTVVTDRYYFSSYACCGRTPPSSWTCPSGGPWSGSDKTAPTRSSLRRRTASPPPGRSTWRPLRGCGTRRPLR